MKFKHVELTTVDRHAARLSAPDPVRCADNRRALIEKFLHIGVQLVECALESWRERRWVDVPPLDLSAQFATLAAE